MEYCYGANEEIFLKYVCRLEEIPERNYTAVRGEFLNCDEQREMSHKVHPLELRFWALPPKFILLLLVFLNTIGSLL